MYFTETCPACQVPLLLNITASYTKNYSCYNNNCPIRYDYHEIYSDINNNFCHKIIDRSVWLYVGKFQLIHNSTSEFWSVYYRDRQRNGERILKLPIEAVKWNELSSLNNKIKKLLVFL